MVYTQKQWTEKVVGDEEFGKQYLVNCIMNLSDHSLSEVKEYCDRLSRSIDELELIERTEML